MSNVLNWQLGRDMEYPYEAAYPDQQFAFIFNINRCIGCQTCTMACKSTWTFSKGQEYMWWNNVETKPGVGYSYLWEDHIFTAPVTYLWRPLQVVIWNKRAVRYCPVPPQAAC